MPGLCPGRRAAVAAALAPLVLVVLAGVLGQAVVPGPAARSRRSRVNAHIHPEKPG